MLERLVNEDREGAEELFHEIVVERSRQIYEQILESEYEDEDETDDDLDESFGLDEFEMESPMGGDATDDLLGDVEVDDMDMGDEGDLDTDDEMEDDADVEDRVQDLEDALEELKAEFDAMMSDDDSDEDDLDVGDEGDLDVGDEDDADMSDDDETEEAFAYESEEDLEEAKKSKKYGKKTAGEEMREYVEKISGGGLDAKKIGGDNGANTKSTVASKNDMGGTASNILRADTEQGVEAAKGQIKGSSLHKAGTKEDNAGNINVPGGKAGKTSFKKAEPGHGAEKKGKPETADKGAHSTIRTTVRNK